MIERSTRVCFLVVHRVRRTRPSTEPPHDPTVTNPATLPVMARSGFHRRHSLNSNIGSDWLGPSSP